ncbi:MAG: YjbE family putative metal transport protein [Magnetospirillum sp.]|nr:YjbE family putative metal transport protein [Magnetospirillum sp.]
MTGYLQLDVLTAFLSVVAIDVALAGDNAIVVGMAAAGLGAAQRRRAIVAGIVAAALLRILFAIFTVQLLDIVGLLFAGGLLLLWVSWKLWREIRRGAGDELEALENETAPTEKGKTFRQAVTQIIVADISMSLDNVLAVAGAAREHTWVLAAGLGLSVGLTGLAANLVARLLNRHRWLAYFGLAIVLYVSLRMIWDGGHALLAPAAFR